MISRLITVLMCIGFLTAGAAAQGIFLRFTPHYDFMQVDYESPWQDYIEFGDKTSYGFGADIGYIYQPRMLAMQFRISTGLHYRFVDLNANIVPKEMIDSGFIVNTGYTENYQMLNIPVMVEVMYRSRTSRIAPGFFVALNNTVMKKASGETTLVDGRTEPYDIPTQEYVPSIAAGVFVDFILSRTISLEVGGGYDRMLKSILKDTEATLTLHAINIKAGLIVQLR